MFVDGDCVQHVIVLPLVLVSSSSTLFQNIMQEIVDAAAQEGVKNLLNCVFFMYGNTKL